MRLSLSLVLKVERSPRPEPEQRETTSDTLVETSSQVDRPLGFHVHPEPTPWDARA